MNLKNIHAEQRVQQTNQMLKRAYPNQEYQVQNEKQADAVLTELSGSPYAQQFDTFFGSAAIRQGGAESIHNPSSTKQTQGQGQSAQHASSQSQGDPVQWDSDATSWLRENEDTIASCVKR